MPFVNEAQRRACYAQQRKALSIGKVPKWNCSEYGKDKKNKKITLKKLYTGPRGGRYYIINDRKIYV